MTERWPRLVVALHWLSALLLFGLVTAGFVMVGLAPEDPLRRVVGKLHSLSGITLGVVMTGRLLARVLMKGPAPIPLPPLHRAGISATHVLLYLALFGMVASGLATALGSSWHDYLDGVLTTPPVLSAMRSRQVHGTLVFVVLLLVGAHVAGVLVQQLRKGGTLRRMLPYR